MDRKSDYGTTLVVKKIIFSNVMIVAGLIFSAFSVTYPYLVIGSVACLTAVCMILIVSTVTSGVISQGKVIFGFDSPASHVGLKYYHLFPFFLLFPSKVANVSRNYAHLKFLNHVEKERMVEKDCEQQAEIKELRSLLESKEGEIENITLFAREQFNELKESAKKSNEKLKKTASGMRKAIDNSQVQRVKMQRIVANLLALSQREKINGVLEVAKLCDEASLFDHCEWTYMLSEARRINIKTSVITVLHADDCRDERMMMKNFISRINAEEGWKFKLVQARDGKEGMGMFASEFPDIIITDQVMSYGGEGKNGNEFAGNIRAIDPLIPIIVRSGSSQKELSELYRGLSVEFIGKRSSYGQFMHGLIRSALYGKDTVEETESGLLE
jgi:hypothetical protein